MARSRRKEILAKTKGHALWKRKTMDVPPKRRSLAKTENGQASNGWQHYYM